MATWLDDPNGTTSQVATSASGWLDDPTTGTPLAQQVTKPWNLFDAVKQLGSGAIEGTAGTLATIADLNPFNIGSQIQRALLTGETPLDFPMAKQAQATLDPYLATKDPNYRYTRTIGQFVGPSGAAGLAAKGLKAAGALPLLADALSTQATPLMFASGVTGGIGAQAAESITGDKILAPIGGALVGGVAPSLVMGGFSALRRLLTDRSQQEITGSAAHLFKKLTGLSGPDLDAAIAAMPDDELAQFMTTAEVTGNAGAAQIEKELTKAGAGAIELNRLETLREAARQRQLGSLSSVPAVNREGLGQTLIDSATDRLARGEIEAKNLWEAVPRYELIDVEDLQKSVGNILGTKQAGLPPGSKVSTLIKQIMGGEGDDAIRTSGALQDIRSDALSLLRDSKLSATEQRVLSTISEGVDGAMMKGLEGEAYDLYKLARDTTRTNKEVFRAGSAGGSLIDYRARAATILRNVFKGDSQSINEMRQAVGVDPDLWEGIKRGVLDMIMPGEGKSLTEAGLRKFTKANEGALKELFKDSGHEDFLRVVEDLRSQNSVQEVAFRASRGNSITSQSNTVGGAITDAILDSIIPGGSFVGKVGSELQKAAAVKTTEQIHAKLLEAALNPKIAKELAMAPTTERVMSLMQRIGATLKDAGIKGARAAGLEIGRPQFSETKKTGAPGLLASQQQTQQAKTPKTIQPSIKGGELPAQYPQSGRSQLSERSPSSSNPTPTPPPKQLKELSNLSNDKDIEKAVAKKVRSGKTEALAKEEAIQESGKDPLAPLIKSMVRQESDGQADAVSHKGAVGLMQIMPSTAKQLARELGWDRYNLKNPTQNKIMGSYYIRKLIEEFGDIPLALTAYNQGPTRIRNILKRHDADSLDEIVHLLGPDGRKYAKQILSRLT